MFVSINADLKSTLLMFCAASLLATCARKPIAVPSTDSARMDANGACATIALEKTEEIKIRCGRLLRYTEPTMPSRTPITAISRCGQTASGNKTRYALLGQQDPKKTRRLYFVSAGLQGLFVNKTRGGRPSALTGQPQGHASIACDAPITIATDSLLSIILHDRELYHENDTAIIAVFSTGGRITVKNLADNFTMLAFWKTQVMARADDEITRDFIYAGMSLGGALAAGLASDLDDVYRRARHTLVAQSPVGRRHGWIYPIDNEETYRNPGGENARGLTRIMQKGWYAHHMTDRSAWRNNVGAAAWLSGAPKVGYHEAWSTALGPIKWNAYTHDEVGTIFHPEVQLDQASFLRERAGLPRYPDPVLLPESKTASERCIEDLYLPAWNAAYVSCSAGYSAEQDLEE